MCIFLLSSGGIHIYPKKLTEYIYWYIYYVSARVWDAGGGARVLQAASTQN